MELRGIPMVLRTVNLKKSFDEAQFIHHLPYLFPILHSNQLSQRLSTILNVSQQAILKLPSSSIQIFVPPLSLQRYNEKIEPLFSKCIRVVIRARRTRRRRRRPASIPNDNILTLSRIV